MLTSFWSSLNVFGKIAFVLLILGATVPPMMAVADVFAEPQHQTPWVADLPHGAIVQSLSPGWQKIAFNNHTYLRHYWQGGETIVPMETGK